MTPATLTDLLERVKACEGADREIDTDLERLVLRPADGQWETEVVSAPPGYGFTRWVLRKADGTLFVHGRARNYTESLDAALALTERVLPGYTMAMDGSAPDLGYDWDLFPPEAARERVTGTHKDLVLALIAALLSALIAQSAHDKTLPAQSKGEG